MESEFNVSEEKKTISNINLYLATCAVNLLTTAAGSTMTWTSPTLPKLEIANDKIVISREQGAWLGSLLPLGACFGPIITSVMVSKIGKKYSLLLHGTIIIICWLIISMVNFLEVIYVTRFFTGMAVGSIFNLVPVYVGEISTINTREITGSLFTFFLFFGFCICYIIGPYTSILTLILICAMFPLLAITLIAWIPESPHYLLEKGYKQQAYFSLQCLRSYPDKSVIQRELVELQEMFDQSYKENCKSNSFSVELFQSRNLKSLYYASALIFFQQMSGFNAVIFYSQSIFQRSASEFSSSISTIICGVIMLFTASFLPFITKLFRMKTVLYLSAVGCSFCLALLGFYFYALEQKYNFSCSTWIPIFAIIGFIFFHSIGLGSYSWVIVAEIFHPNVKTVATAMTTSLCWFLCFLITRFFSTLIDTLGASGTMIVFVCFCLLAILFLVIQLPDTQGKSFQEIQELIGGKKYYSVKSEI